MKRFIQILLGISSFLLLSKSVYAQIDVGIDSVGDPSLSWDASLVKDQDNDFVVPPKTLINFSFDKLASEWSTLNLFVSSENSDLGDLTKLGSDGITRYYIFPGLNNVRKWLDFTLSDTTSYQFETVQPMQLKSVIVDKVFDGPNLTLNSTIEVENTSNYFLCSIKVRTVLLDGTIFQRNFCIPDHTVKQFEYSNYIGSEYPPVIHLNDITISDYNFHTEAIANPLAMVSTYDGASMYINASTDSTNFTLLPYTVISVVPPVLLKPDVSLQAQLDPQLSDTLVSYEGGSSMSLNLSVANAGLDTENLVCNITYDNSKLSLDNNTITIPSLKYQDQLQFTVPVTVNAAISSASDSEVVINCDQFNLESRIPVKVSPKKVIPPVTPPVDDTQPPAPVITPKPIVRTYHPAPVIKTQTEPTPTVKGIQSEVIETPQAETPPIQIVQSETSGSTIKNTPKSNLWVYSYFVGGTLLILLLLYLRLKK